MREISFVDPDATKPYIGQIFPLILDSIKDQSDFQKREVALNTLISMIENTGFVVKPYFFYPELLPIIRLLVQSEPNPAIKELVFKLIGTLGAVDPYLINQIKFYHKMKNANEDDEMLNGIPQMLGISEAMLHPGDGADEGSGEADIKLDINRPLPDDYAADLGLANTAVETTLKRYKIDRPEVTKRNKASMAGMEALIKILNDRTLIDHHGTVLKNLIAIVQEIGPDSAQFFPLIIPSILNCIADSVAEAPKKHLYQCLLCIIDTVPSAITQYQSMIFDTIESVVSQ
jgi:hypothetical protein